MHLVGFYYKNISRCTVLWISNTISEFLCSHVSWNAIPCRWTSSNRQMVRPRSFIIRVRQSSSVQFTTRLILFVSSLQTIFGTRLMEKSMPKECYFLKQNYMSGLFPASSFQRTERHLQRNPGVFTYASGSFACIFSQRTKYYDIRWPSRIVLVYKYDT